MCTFEEVRGKLRHLVASPCSASFCQIWMLFFGDPEVCFVHPSGDIFLRYSPELFYSICPISSYVLNVILPTKVVGNSSRYEFLCFLCVVCSGYPLFYVSFKLPCTSRRSTHDFVPPNSHIPHLGTKLRDKRPGSARRASAPNATSWRIYVCNCRNSSCFHFSFLFSCDLNLRNSRIRNIRLGLGEAVSCQLCSEKKN
jgi:hypothetical protein